MSETKVDPPGSGGLDQELVEILACPETRQAVSIAGPELLAALNARVRAGTVKNRGGVVVEEELESGLVREDGKLLYPVRDGIPIMLVEESIDLG